MLAAVFKKTFWTVYDNLGTVFWLSGLWTLLSLPFFGCIAFFLFGSFRSLPFALTVFNALWTSPVSAALVHQAGGLIEERHGGRKFSFFWEGLKKHFVRSFFLCVWDTVVFFVLFRALLFWLRNPLGLFPSLSWAAAGLVFWIMLFQASMKFGLLPLLVLRGEGLLQTVRKAALLVLACKRVLLGVALFSAGFLIIMLFSGAGFILFFPAFFFVLSSVLTLTVLAVYNPDVKIEPETRTWKNLMRPWE